MKMKWETALLFLVALLLGNAAYGSVQAFNASGADLGHFSKFQCSTGMTCTRSNGRLNMVSSPELVGPLTLESDETISNATDDTVTIASNDSTTTLQIKGFEASGAVLELWADEGDDTADKYSLSVPSTGSLIFKNNTTTLASLNASGTLTLADSEYIANSSDTVTIGFDDGAANVNVLGFEASNASLVLQADESDDNGDDWRFTSNASGNALTISNDVSGSYVAKITVAASDGDITLTGGITGDGGDQLVGFLQSQVAATASTLTAAQCGATFINSGAVQVELPEASTVLGCRYTFITGNASNFDVNPDNADQILVQTNAAGDAMRNATLGNSITIQAISASEWAPVAVVGTWSDID